MDQTQAYRTRVESTIRAWDREVTYLIPEKQSKYENYRDTFRRRMKVWVERAEAEGSEFVDDIEEDFEKLESHWHRLHDTAHS